MATQITFNSRDKAIVDALKLNEKGLTLAQLSEATGLELKPGHITSAVRKGLAVNAGKISIERDGSREVDTYSFVTADALSNADGKAFNYTDSEKEILGVAPNLEAEFTLNQLSTAVGRKLVSGSISGLIKKGNFTKTGNKVDEPCKVKSNVSLYVFGKDIPADAKIVNVDQRQHLASKERILTASVDVEHVDTCEKSSKNYLKIP